MLKQIIHHKRSVAAAILTCDVLFFSLTTPKNSSIPVMVLGFLLLLCTIYILSRILFGLLRLLGYGGPTKKLTQQLIVLSVFVLIVLQAIGQLSLKDVLALIPLSVVGYFYFSFISSHQQAD